MTRVYIETYGCAVNQNDSEIMAGYLKKHGYSLADNIDNADVVIINTCIVKSVTENKIMHRIKELKNKKLVIAGCMPQSQLKRLRKTTGAPVLGPRSLFRIAEAVEATINEKEFEALSNEAMDKIKCSIAETSVRSIVQISEGCLSKCSFCETRLARGSLSSYAASDIANRIKKSVSEGKKEIWLTAQDCGCYGFDIRTNLAALLNKILKMDNILKTEGEYFIRLGMANPIHIKRYAEELIACFQDKHMFKFIHMPLQSGSDNILKKMRRGHTVQDYMDIVDVFKKEIPEITIWTDIIAGFPGETEKDFEKTINALEKTRPDFVNVSAFSSRPNTEASKLKKIPTEIVKERTKRTSELAGRLALESNKEWIGWSGLVLIDEYNKKKGNFIGRNFVYKPVAIKNNGSKKKIWLGVIANVKIIDAEKTCLIGSIQG